MFERDEHGWIEMGEPSEETWRRAVERERRQRKRGTYGSTDDFEMAARGFAAEYAVARWLDAEGVSFVHHGGVDDLPDIDLSGVGVGVKIRGTTGRSRMNYHVAVQRRQLDKNDAVTELLWVAHERPPRDCYRILGGYSVEATRAEATLVRKGERHQAFGFKPTDDTTLVLDCRVIEPPDQWLDRVRRGRHSTAVSRRCGAEVPTILSLTVAPGALWCSDCARANPWPGAGHTVEREPALF